MLSDADWEKRQEEWTGYDVTEVALGYAIKAMFWSQIDEDTMKSVIVNMKYFMDTYSVDESISVYEKSSFKNISLENDKTNSF